MQFLLLAVCFLHACGALLCFALASSLACYAKQARHLLLMLCLLCYASKASKASKAKAVSTAGIANQVSKVVSK
jgi:hypothetical protein